MSSQRNQLVATAAVVAFTGALIWTLGNVDERPPNQEDFFLDVT